MPDNSVVVVGGSKPFYATDVSAKTQVITGACTIGNILLLNSYSGGQWVAFYDALAANVTPGTTAPQYVEFVPAAAAGVPGRTVVTVPANGGLFLVALTLVASLTNNGAASGAAAVPVSGWYH